MCDVGVCCNFLGAIVILWGCLLWQIVVIRPGGDWHPGRGNIPSYITHGLYIYNSIYI